jgi:hypothetical protein
MCGSVTDAPVGVPSPVDTFRVKAFSEWHLSGADALKSRPSIG